MFHRSSLLRTVLFVLPLLAFSQCATIFGHSRYPVTVNSVPTGAEVNIINRDGVNVYSGVTPARVNLKSGNGYFKRGSYEITVSMNGYETVKQLVEFQLNGWYIGNIAIGGLIGFLIVDPLTGAMWMLPKNQRNIAVTLQEDEASGGVGLRVINLNEVPQQLRSSLVRIK